MGLPVGGEGFIPGCFGGLPGGARVPSRINILGNLKGRLVPVQGPARGVRGAFAQRRTVAGGGIGLGRAEADMGMADDQAGTGKVRAGLGQGFVQGLAVVPVNGADNLPAVGTEARAHVFAEPCVDLAVNGNAVGVIKHNEFAQAPGPGQGAGLVRDAFHQASVAAEGIGAVVHHRLFRGIELGGQHAFGQSHAHGRGNALAQRTGGHFHAGRQAALGMPRRLGAPLAEILDFLNGKIIAGEMEHRVLEHGGVPVGKQPGLAGLCLKPCRQRASAMSAMPRGAPGWPERDFSMASMARARMALAHCLRVGMTLFPWRYGLALDAACRQARAARRPGRTARPSAAFIKAARRAS